MPRRADIRNVAIIAHVDHGKTTLVDAMLRQSGIFSAHEAIVRPGHGLDGPGARARDHDPGQERRRSLRRGRVGPVKINIVDTPGHADFGGEVERGLTMVDGVLLLVDASEGPLPQTRFVLRKALERRLPVILVINKVDRPDARIGEVVDEVYELFIDLDAARSRSSSRSSTPTPGPAGRRWSRASRGRPEPAASTCSSAVPAPEYKEGHGLQALVTNLDAFAYVGRLALCRVHNGTMRKGADVAWCRHEAGRCGRRRSSSSTSPRGMSARRGRRGRAGRHHRPRRHSRDHDR